MNPKFLLFILFYFVFAPTYARDNFKTNKTVYYPKSLIFFYIELSKDSYVYILNESVSGTLHLLFPNSDDPENYFTKGNYRIPAQNAKYEFQLDEDTGEETFYFIVSKVKIAKLHFRNFREHESLTKPQWLRRLTSDLYPLDWKIYEQKINIINTR